MILVTLYFKIQNKCFYCNYTIKMVLGHMDFGLKTERIPSSVSVFLVDKTMSLGTTY